MEFTRTTETISILFLHFRIRDMCPNFYRMFVESQVPSHAAALALLLSRTGPLDCSKIPFKPRDLVQAISRVLVSPLAQSQSSRSRLLWAMSESTISTANHGTPGQVDPAEAFELPMTLGIPQFNWPASHGWLDGVFELALNQCTQAALALLLSRTGPLDCSKIPFKPRDLVQAISRVLVSPLAQSQSSRSRLLWAMSESTISTANHGTPGQVDPAEAFELPMTLGIPQFNWPASHGWLDGVFELALNQCTQMDTVFMYHWTETKLHDRLWQCLEHVFNLGGCADVTLPTHPAPDWSMLSPRGVCILLRLACMVYTKCLEHVFNLGGCADVTLPTHPAPDWSMLSPRGVCILLRLACMVYTKEVNLYNEEIRKSHSPMLSCVNYMFTPMFIKSVIDNTWNALTVDGIVSYILASASELLQLPLQQSDATKYCPKTVPKQYLEHELLTNLGRVAARLHENNAAFVSSKTPDKNCIQMIHLSRLQAHVVSDLPNMLRTLLGRGTDSQRRTPHVSANGSAAVGQFVQVVRWCLSCSTAELRAGACVLLNRTLICKIVEDFPKRVEAQNHSCPQLPRSTGHLVWLTLSKSETEPNEDHLSAEGCILHDLLADTDAVVVTQALNLFANLCLLTPSGSSDYEAITVPSLRRASSVCYTIGDFYNQKVHRPIPHTSVKANIKLIPNTDPLWHSLCEPFIKLSAKSLDAEQTTVRQAALLVLGNALYRFEGACEICVSLLDKLNKLLTEDASARVRANAAVF
ncbi:hypothetical protein AHF37_03527 [Paragonimus kellicotti]|nr:hypothetical protein AHF37_03527 [Paragonimus kellicotti]